MAPIELNSVIATLVCGAVAAYVLAWSLLHLTQGRDEPPVLLTSVPFMSPILGMIQWSKDFYSHMREQNQDLPIYTLRLPGVRIYAINSLDLIPAVQRQWRKLIFAPIQVKAAKAAMGASKEALGIMERDLVTEQGFMGGMVKATHPTMSSGPALDTLNTSSFEVFDKAMKQLSTPTTVNMYDWISRLIMQATTEAIYGPSNPMRNRRNLDAWSKFHPALMYIMLDVLPQGVFFGEAVQARGDLVKAFKKYYVEGSYRQGSAYIQKFTEHCISQEIPEDDIPRLLVGTVFNNVANTIPTAFWVIYRIFSDPDTLEECRREVNQAVRPSDKDKASESVLDLSLVLNSCPTLLSTYHEVFRFHGMANSVRVVSEDCALQGSESNRVYRLRKGGLVMMSARAQHSNPDVWGPDVDEFRHDRFLKQQGRPRPNPVAFRGFGGGTTLCPGRHFATAEILMLAAMLLLRFDVHPAGGEWDDPTTEKSSQAEAVEQPDDDIEIVLAPRPEAAGKTWRVESSGRRDAELLVQK
ncbi:hypothetical protein KVR01_008694 [Diaporthe batatas]|uniref:uncharacterized protein n=1 Tax=Diaporthe batatas TaxID=748121 RepID=UPI001D03B69C|nr:uncharacterized protein KVR01_008694 [Diaporthe batatas]KAG8161707.1 hypothetical protein KVR01_008694 [Diaporthe batatas]